MAKNPFSNTTNTSKKKTTAGSDDIFAKMSKLASQNLNGSSGIKTTASKPSYQSKVEMPTMPTVSTSVGNHLSDYGEFKGSQPSSPTPTVDTAKRKQEIEARLKQIQTEYSTTATVLSGYQRGGMKQSNAYAIAQAKADELLAERGALEKELQDLREQAIADGGVRDATLKDYTVNAFKQGYYNSRLGEESYDAMMGSENEQQKYADILAGEDYQFAGGNAFEDAVAGAAQLLGQQARQLTNLRTLGSAATGGIAGFGVGTVMGGGLGSAITAPAGAIKGAAAGFTAGSAASNFEIEAGLAYNEMIENGVSPETAKKVALAVGGVNAALELVQLDELTKSFKILKNNPATEGVADSLGKRLIDMGVDVSKSVGKETLQEVAQEGSTIAGVQAATKKDTGEWAYNTGEVVDRLADTAKSSALSFGVMNVPHIAVGTHNAVRTDRVGSNYNADIDALIDEGLQSDQNSESYKKASEFKARRENGGTVSNVEAYDLAVANQRAINTENKLAVANRPVQTVESPVETAPVQSRVQTIQARLAESGMETARAEAVATSVDRILKGDTTVTNKDKDALSVGNAAARAIFEEETGIKLPTSNSSTRKTVSEYIAQTALKQQKATTEESSATVSKNETVVNQTPVNVMSAEAINQLKSSVAMPTATANNAEATLRQAAEIAVSRAKVDNAITVQSDMTSLGTHGKATYQKHLGNAKSITGYSNAFQRYYDAGQIGLPFESIKTAYDGAVDRSVLFEAYSAGQNDASGEDRGKPTLKNKNAQKDKKTPSKGKGKFYDSRTSEGKAVDDQTTAVLKQFAKVFNVDIELVDTIPDSKGRSIANGYYANGKVVLAADSDNPLMTVLKHEVTHHLQKTSPKQYKAFKDYVMKAYYQNSQEVMNAEIQRRIDLAALNNVTLTRAAAMDEIVADATESFLTDRDSIDALVRENRNLAETVLDAIRDVLRKIEAAMKGESLKGYSDFMNTDQLKQAEKMWVDALAAAADVREIGVNFAEITESSAPVWSLKSMKFDLLDGQMQRDLVTHGIMTAEESQNLMDQISKLIDDMSPFAHIVDMNEEYSKGNRPFNVYKPNSDPLYKVSLDFSTLCKKRLMTQFVMESLQTKLGKALSAKEQLAIRSKLEEYGKTNQQIQVACALCYVEARRLKAPDQINRFLDDRTTILTDYFGKKNKEYKQSVDDMADRMKVDLGYKAETKLKDMKPSDKKKVNEAKQKMMKEYIPSAEEQKIIERANAIDNKEFLSQAGLTNLSLNDPVIYDAFVSHVRNATKSKALESGVPYYYGDSKSVSDSLIESMNAENGLRHQSWSDFEIVHLLDNIAAVIELSVRKAKMQAYTKVPDFVHVNGNTGMMINLSLIPAGKTGIKDGKLDFSPTEGMDFEVAVGLRGQYHKTAGTIAIGIDDKQIQMMLDDETIDYVIPYHTSGMNAQLRKMAGISGWADYESFQSEKEIKGAKQGNCPDELWHKKPDFSEWFDTSKLDMSKSGVEIMREAAGRYLVMCEERGLHPKFSNTKQHTDFSKHDNYWKLLIDRKMVDGNGNIIIQQAVRPDFDFGKISEIVKTEVKNYDPTLLDSINEMISNEWESGGIKQREKELLAEEKKAKKAKKKAAKVANGLLEQVVMPEGAQASFKTGKYDYDTLVAKPDMVLTEVDDTVQYNTDSKSKKNIVNEAKKNAAIIGRTNENGGVEVYVDDIGVNVVLATDGLKHGLDRRTQLLAPVTVNAGQILKNAIRINELLPRKDTIANTYALLGAARGKSGDVYIVEFVVNRFDNTVASMDVLYSVNTKKESAALNAPRLTVNPLSVTDSKISIAQLLDLARDNFPDVLPESVLRHYGFDRRPDGVLGEDVLFSLKDSDYMAAVESGDMETAQKMVDQAAKEAGYDSPKLYHGTYGFGFTKIKTSGVEAGAEWSPFFATNNIYTAMTYSGKAAKTEIGRKKRPKKTIATLRGEALALLANGENASTGFVDAKYRDSYVGQYGNIMDDDTVRLIRDGVEGAYAIDYRGTEFKFVPYEEGFSVEDYKNKAGNYGLYANTDDLLIVDGEGREWNRLRSEYGSTTRIIAKNALAAGYKGVIIRNVYDTGMDWDGYIDEDADTASDVHIFFNPESQVKSADPVTYDDNGNVIPLSERFKAENDDIRYSMKDSAGNTLTKAQAEYFKDSRVRDEDGNLKVMYHGTNTPNFTVFDPSFSDDGISLFFTSSPDVADSYTSVQQGGRNLDPYRLPHTIKTLDEYNRYMEDIGSETRIIQVTDEVIEKAQRDVDKLVSEDKRLSFYYDKVHELEGIKGKFIHYNGGINYITRRDSIRDTAEELIREDTNDKYWTPHRFGNRYSVYLKMEKPYILDAGKHYKGIGELTIKQGFEDTEATFSVNGEDFVVTKGYKESYEDFAHRFLAPKEAEKFLRKVEAAKEKFIREEMEMDGKTREEVIAFWSRHGGIEPEPFTHKVKQASIDYTEAGVWKYLEWEGNTGNTRALAKWAKDNEYDGVIIENLKDIGGYSGGTVTNAATIAIAFESNQVKSTNNANPTSDPDIRYQLKTPDEMLEVTEQLRHEAKAVTDAEIMSQALEELKLTGIERTVIKNYQEAMKNLADYQKELAVYEATNGQHSKHRSIYTDASGKVKKSAVKRSAREKADIQKDINWWKNRLNEIEQKETFQKVLKREKAKMAETHAKKMAKLRDVYDQRLRDVRAKRDEKIEAEKQKMRDYKQHQRDSKEYKALKSKLEADVKWLDERLRHPTDAKHIPEEFKKGVAAFLDSLDFTSPWTDRYEVVNGVPSQKKINLTAMKEAYKKILDDQSSTMELDETQYEALKELENICKDKRVVDLDYAELGLVRDAIQYIKMSVAVADKAFNAEIKESISAMGEALIQEQRSKKVRKNSTGIVGEADKLLHYGNVAPADKFHRYGGVMEKLYGEIRKGFDKHISNVQSAINYTQQLIAGNEAAIKEWSGKNAKATKFQISDGTTIELTPAQVMSLYALMKRDQAVGHVLGSGIVTSGVVVRDVKKLGKVNLPATKKLYSDRASRCTIEDIQKIVDTLTDDQKKIADGVMKLFTTKCADWGNETSMKLYGYKKFLEPNYFPIRSSDAYLNARFDDSGDVLIKNLGFTKNTVVNANNPIVVEDIFDVLADHVNKMSMYNALVVPLTDFSRVFNYKSKGINQDGEVVVYDSVKKALEASGGELGVDYVKQFIKDVNKQPTSVPAESLFNKAIANYKKAKIGANLRVLAQQPTSITRAAAMVDPKYLIKGLQQKANYKEMFNHSEIAYWKSLGFYQTDMGRNMKDILLGNESALDNVTMGVYGKADDFAWGHLWEAIKLEQADAHPGMDTTSSEFLDLVADRFEEVVDRTQVVDSVFHRSQLMRSPTVAAKVATAFMSEPVKNYNLLTTALYDSVNSKDYSGFRRVAATFVVSSIATAALAGIVDAFRDDEDEDDEGNKRNIADKYLENTLENIRDNLNPLAMIPLLKEVSSLWNGYSVNRMEMESIDSLVKSAKMLAQDKYSLPHKFRSLASSICEMTGIPMKNVLRELDTIARTVGNAVGGYHYGEYFLEKCRHNISNSDNRSVFYKHYTDALLAGDEKAAAMILEDMVVNGIPYDNIVSRGYQKQKEVAFSEARKLIAAGKADEARDLIRNLAKKYDKKYTTLWKAVKGGDSASAPEETYDFKDLKTAIRKDQDTELIEDYLLNYGGYSEEALEEAVKMLTEKYK